MISPTPIAELTEARKVPAAGDRLDALVEAGKTFRKRFAAGPTVHAIQTCELSTLPYPTRFAFWGAARNALGYVLLKNRMQIVQLDLGGEELETVLVNPSDIDGNLKTPYLHRIAGRFPEMAQKLFKIGRTHEHLNVLGIEPEDVDYVTFDHLHTQDIQSILQLYSKAKLIVQRAEWDSLKNLHPVQRHWYIENCTDGIEEDRLMLIDGDVELGGGAAILFTPGHTVGNHSITLNTEGGIYCISENGTSADSYAPRKSTIPGLSKFAHLYGVEVILNANTLQSSEEQYNSMILERTVAGPSPRNPDFYNVVSSSELTPWLAAPRMSPTFSHGKIRFGAVAPGATQNATGQNPSA